MEIGKNWTLGIDPGMTGAWAILDDDGYLLDADHLPVMGEGKRKQIAVVILAQALEPHLPQISSVVIERVHSSPQQGVASAFTFGRSYGTMEGMIATMQMPLTYVSPVSWKKHFRLQGARENKDEARQLALQMWPRCAGLLSRKKDSARAEAALIAAYHRQL